MQSKSPKLKEITPAFLRSIALPQPEAGGDKNERGSALMIGGTIGMPGAVLLSAEGALRAGAGKLQIATLKSLAPGIALQIPESKVTALPETKKGALRNESAKIIRKQKSKWDAILVGPGMQDPQAIRQFLMGIRTKLKDAVLILDAEAIKCLSLLPSDWARELKTEVIITPHGGEMADLMEISKSKVLADPLAVAQQCAKKFQVITVLKGRETFIVSPGGECLVNRSGNVGLATSGSGDVLAGVLTGLAARGAPALDAAAWGVYLHAKAGEALAKKLGGLGYLARELLVEIPAINHQLS